MSLVKQVFPFQILVLTALCLAACERGGAPENPRSLARSSAPLTVTAVYDATLKAPKCGTAASGCDTGTLVNGRATLGPESNAPNTLGGTCADGTSGSYHSDESLDRVQVFTNDGTALAPGKTVTLSATVWAYSGYTSDQLDLYYAADATNPIWTFIATLTPAGSGAQTLTASYVLPSGGAVQAVRAAFRFGGSAGPCVSGTYNDRDDLAFLVSSDTVPPTTDVTSPASGATVLGTLNLTASASDNQGVTKVEYYVDNGLVGSATAAPYTVAWNTLLATNGGHTLVSKAYDAAGNVGTSAALSFTINNPPDTTPPTVTISTPANDATVTTTVNLTASASDDRGVTKVEYYVDSVLVGSATASPYTVAWNAASSSTGTHTLVSKAYDAAGNVGTSASISVTRPPDTTPPTTAVTSPTSGTVINSTDFLLWADASDNVAVTKVEFYLDSVLLGVSTHTSSPYGLRWDSTTASKGSHTLVSKAYDAAGNVSTSSPITFQVNNPPFAAYDATLKAPRCGTLGIGCDTGTLVNGRATLGPESNAPNTLGGTCADGTSGTYHGSESVDRVRVYTVDGGNFAPGKSIRVEVTLWVPSSYTTDRLELYHAADANNPTWTLITTLTPGWAFGQTLTATYTLPTGGTVQAVRAALRNGGAAGACVTGVYNDRDDVAFAVNADTSPPSVAVSTPTAGSTVGGAVSFSVNATDNVAVTKVEYYLDSALHSTVTSGGSFPATWSSTLAANGTHTLMAKAYDAAGNVGSSSSVTFTLFNDKTPPTVSVTSPTSGAFLTGTATLTATATDNVGVTSVTFLVDNMSVGQTTTAPYSVTWNTATYSAGGHTLTARACDAAGYCGTSAPINITVDTFAPSLSLSAGGPYVRGTVNIQANAVDDIGVTKLELYIDGTLAGSSTVSPYVLAWNTTTAAQGSHTLSAKAYDAAGHVTTSSTSTTVDNTAPTTSVTSPVSGAYLQGTVTLTANASDNLSVNRVVYYLDDQLIGSATTPPYTVSWDSRSFPSGNHVLTSRAYDPADNIGTSAGIPVTLDSGPTVTLTSPRDGGYVSGTVNFTALAADDHGVAKVEYYAGGYLVGSATAPPYTVAWNTTALANGKYFIQAYAYDTVGTLGVSTTLSVAVRNLVTAAYSSSLGVPRCARGTACDSGTLLDGRAGSEPNTPNTLGGTCQDGTSGSYHVEPSVDRVKISTTAGGFLTPGKAVTVEVSVWASSNYTSEQLELYYTADAATPSWVYLTTLAPSAPGAQTLTASYTLPFGGDVQAVRAAFRSGGTAGTCAAGLYNDRDDLAFSVGTYLLPQGQRVAAGDYHVLVLRDDGTVWAWGNNAYGKLGDGTATDRRYPTRVQGLSAMVALAAGADHSVALREDGTVWTWGANASGQLGDGTLVNRNTPVQVPGLTGITAISAGGWHTLALREDGTVWAWGHNAYGQLGDGTTTNQTAPVQVPGVTGVRSLSGGRYHSLVSRTDGTVFSWGYNLNGSLGDGTTTVRLSPLQVPGLTDVTAVAAGMSHSLALRANGTLMAWGSNNAGQLGDGTTTDRLSPMPVPSFRGITSIAAGASYSLAMSVGGTLWSWGINSRGELGTGTGPSRATPAQVTTQSAVLVLPSSTTSTAMVVLAPSGADSTGSYWVWGDNLYGQVGNGSTSQGVSSPTWVTTIPAPPL